MDVVTKLEHRFCEVVNQKTDSEKKSLGSPQAQGTCQNSPADKSLDDGDEGDDGHVTMSGGDRSQQ
jgi:hypothetical protein